MFFVFALSCVIRIRFCYDARMQWIIVGLGNPDREHEGERHNTGRALLQQYAKKEKLEWRTDAKANALVAKCGATFLLPETFMNKSGSAVGKYVKSVKAAEHLLVVYDDMDLPLGRIKISYDRSAGGHNGLKSIERAVKTKKFWRLRVGVCPATPSGKLKKPIGEQAVIDFILGRFKEGERETLKKVYKTATEAIECVLADGPVTAMNTYN